MREREARLAQAAASAKQGGGSGGEEEEDGGEGPSDFPFGFAPPVNARGELKMKKSDLYRMQDEEYLQQLRDEHANRRQSHLQRRQRERDAEGDDEATAAEIEKVERELLGHQYSDEGALGGASKRARTERGHGHGHAAPSPEELLRAELERVEKRRRAAKGALFRHPLIGLDPLIVAALAREGFERMTLIQQRAIPYALEGYDILGQARTGSGKTLAFCVPVLHRTRELVQQSPHTTVALALAPTKELCVQTYDVLVSICQHFPKRTVSYTVQLITGGTKVTEERRKLQAGASIVVGTPGRIHDHVEHCKGWNLSALRVLVLDEADRMLADGFQKDLDAVLARIPRGRQTLLFSATNSKSVRELARLSLSRTPVFIGTTGDAPTALTATTGAAEDGGSGSGFGGGLPPLALPPYANYADPDGAATDDDGDDKDDDRSGDDTPGAAPDREGEAIPDTLKQFCHITPLEDRLLTLYAFVKRVARTEKAMIFCSTVASTIFHCQMMASVGFHDDVVMLHGHMKHRQRVETFRVFNEWETGVLFCTDVAARGLDIPNVSWILQFDPPLDPTEYIHRIGRTARAGNVGSSLLFLAPEELKFVGYLSQFGIRLEKYPVTAKLPRLQEKFQHVLQLDPIVAKSAVNAYRAHVGAYQSHILKETFDVARLDLDRLALAFALTATPHVTLPANSAQLKKEEYVKGKLRSLNRRKHEALRLYESNKTKQQWSNGSFIGIAKPI